MLISITDDCSTTQRQRNTTVSKCNLNKLLDKRSQKSNRLCSQQQRHLSGTPSTLAPGRTRRPSEPSSPAGAKPALGAVRNPAGATPALQTHSPSGPPAHTPWQPGCTMDPTRPLPAPLTPQLRVLWNQNQPVCTSDKHDMAQLSHSRKPLKLSC